jgi:hypothetical protein
MANGMHCSVMIYDFIKMAGGCLKKESKIMGPWNDIA